MARERKTSIILLFLLRIEKGKMTVSKEDSDKGKCSYSNAGQALE